MFNRRDFIKTTVLGASAFTLSSAFANSSSTSKTTIPHRFIFARKSNGLIPTQIIPPSFSEAERNLCLKKQPFEVNLKNHELTKCFQALEPYKDRMAIIQGFSSKICDNMHGSESSVLGCYKLAGGIKRATVDFELAKLFPTPFNHIEFAPISRTATGIGKGFSAPAPNRLSYNFLDPETALNEIFKSVLDPEYLTKSKTMYNFLKDRELAKLKNLSGNERLKVLNTIHSIDEVNSRNAKLQSMSEKIKKHLPVLDKICEGLALKANYVQRVEGMTEVLIASLKAGLTNIVHYNLDTINTPVTGLPGLGSFEIDIHGLGHGSNQGGFPNEQGRAMIRANHINQIAKIIEELKKTPEGDGNMFDNTTIMYFPDNGESHHGHGLESPWVVISGKNSKLNIAGRYIRLPYLGEVGHKTLGNWYTTLLNAYGNPIEHYGDLDLEMSRKKLDQTGAIKSFIA